METDLLSKITCNIDEKKWIIIKNVNSKKYHAQLQDYLTNLSIIRKIANAPNLCVKCFCFLSQSQKNNMNDTSSRPTMLKLQQNSVLDQIWKPLPKKINILKLKMLWN